jgi:hypothetical protein
MENAVANLVVCSLCNIMSVDASFILLIASWNTLLDEVSVRSVSGCRTGLNMF